MVSAWALFWHASDAFAFTLYILNSAIINTFNVLDLLEFLKAAATRAFSQNKHTLNEQKPSSIMSTA
jgi:hypothetical protein